MYFALLNHIYNNLIKVALLYNSATFNFTYILSSRNIIIYITIMVEREVNMSYKKNDKYDRFSIDDVLTAVSAKRKEAKKSSKSKKRNGSDKKKKTKYAKHKD